jgi:hypothetical protein
MMIGMGMVGGGGLAAELGLRSRLTRLAPDDLRGVGVTPT